MRRTFIAALAVLALIALIAAVDVSAKRRDRRPPTVTLTYPNSLAPLSGTISLTATAWDNVAVDHVTFSVDGATVGSDSTSPYSAAYDTTQVADGSHSFSARATDTAGNVSTASTVTATVTNIAPPPRPGQYPLRGMFFRQSDGGFSNIVSLGFNLIDSSPSEVSGLPAGVKGLTWVGDYDKNACTWQQSDSQITSYVSAHVGDPKVAVWFIADEPWVGGTPHCPDAPAQVKARSDLIHRIDPNAKTLMIIDSNSGQESLDQVPAWKNTADIIGINPYMCWQGQTCRTVWIDTLAHAADVAGLTYWGVAQAYGEPTGTGQELCDVESGSEHCGFARLPTASEIHDEFVHWRSTAMKSYLVFSWRWPDSTPSLWLENHLDLQSQLAIENGSAGTPVDTTAPAAPSGLTANAGDSRVALDWADNSESDLNHYNVYRSGVKVASPTSSAYTDTGLTNGTAYSYQVTAVDNAGDESAKSSSVSATPQVSSTTDPVITAAGDLCGDTTNCKPTSDLVLNINPATALTLGDNAYEDGTLQEYTSFYDPNWGRFKGITKPTTGNHEFHSGGAAGYHSYFGFSQDYYSYNLGNWHLIALASSAGISPASGGVEETWLKNDLAANTKPCTLAYWHEPRFSSGTVHGSNSDWGAVWQDLYNANAEVVLNGHEHTYERFAPQTPGAVADSSRGIVEVVSGTGGEDGSYPFGTPLTNSVARSGSGTFGVVKMTLHSTSYDLDFVPIPGQTFQDHYSGTCH